MPEVLTANVYEQMKHKQHSLEISGLQGRGGALRAHRIHNTLRHFLSVVLEGEKQQRAVQEAAA